MNIEVREIDKMVFVATCPRSGSSMLCGILEACGAFGGNTNGATAANERGQYENMGVHALAFTPTFQETAINGPRGLLHLVRKGAEPDMPHVKEDVTLALVRQGYDGGVAYFKGGPYMFFFNSINSVWPGCTWVLPERQPDDIVRSMRRMNFPRSDAEAYKDVAAYHEMYSTIENTEGADVWRVDTNGVVEEANMAQVRKLVEHLGLEWNQAAVEQWVDPTLWKRGIDDRPDLADPRNMNRNSANIRRRQTRVGANQPMFI